MYETEFETNVNYDVERNVYAKLTKNSVEIGNHRYFLFLLPVVLKTSI